MGWNLREGKFQLNNGRRFLTVWCIKPWDALPAVVLLLAAWGTTLFIKKPYRVLIKDSFKSCLLGFMYLMRRHANCTPRLPCPSTRAPHLGVMSWLLVSWQWRRGCWPKQPPEPQLSLAQTALLAWKDRLGRSVRSLIRTCAYLPRFSPSGCCGITLWGLVQLQSLG